MPLRLFYSIHQNCVSPTPSPVLHTCRQELQTSPHRSCHHLLSPLLAADVSQQHSWLDPRLFRKLGGASTLVRYVS